MDGPDSVLVLSGSNTYRGGTVVEAGTLIVESPSSIPNGTGLVVRMNAGDFWLRGGQLFEDAEHFTYQHFSWRVKDDLAPEARLDEALRVLAGSIALGMIAFRDLDAQLDDPAEHSAAAHFIDHVASLGLELKP